MNCMDTETDLIVYRINTNYNINVTSIQVTQLIKTVDAIKVAYDQVVEAVSKVEKAIKMKMPRHAETIRQNVVEKRENLVQSVVKHVHDTSSSEDGES